MKKQRYIPPIAEPVLVEEEVMIAQSPTTAVIPDSKDDSEEGEEWGKGAKESSPFFYEDYSIVEF